MSVIPPFALHDQSLLVHHLPPPPPQRKHTVQQKPKNACKLASYMSCNNPKLYIEKLNWT